MTNLNLKQYTLQDFNTIIWGGFTYDLKDSGVIELISLLADKVGAPSYIKTPVFPKREKQEKVDNNNGSSGSNSNKYDNKDGKQNVLATNSGAVCNNGNNSNSNIRRARNKPSQITDDDWNTIRTFQKTELRKVEGIEKRIDTIRSLLNKLTEATYNVVKTEIFDEVKEIIENNNVNVNDSTADEGSVVATGSVVDEENITKIANSIFNTASSNIFYSSLYSKLFNELMSYHEIFKSVFEKSFSEFVGLFKKIDYVDPSVDYNKFCDNTKTNDKRRAMSTFIVNLMKEGVLHPDKVVDIIIELQEMISSYIKVANKTNELEELNENIFILVTNGKDVLSNHEEWERITSKIKFLSVLKVKMKEYPSVNNKLIFKNMDILEELNM
uniref:MIF4G domain-containing protein n=1 Tax=viral metagenome TaxID=1070528 RepID=A0A6C0I265_9ZZZZ